MSEFCVRWKAIQGQSSDMVSISKRLKNISTKLDYVKSNLNSFHKYGDVTSVISSIIEEIRKEADSANALGEVLKEISNEYQKTENKISGKSSTVDKVEEAKSDDSSFDWKLDSLLWKGIAKFGVTGTAIAGFGELITGGVSAKTLLGGANKYITILGDLAKEAYSNQPDYKNVLLGDYKKGGAVESLAKWAAKSGATLTNKGSIFVNSVKKQIADFSLKSCSNLGDKIKVGTKWAGVAISGITNAIKNYEEHGTVKSERFWAETVTETAVDVGMVILSTAAATALLGTAAPAVAVGAAAVAAVWAVDGVTRFITEKVTGEEKGFTELVSDTILDGVGKAGKSFAKWCSSIL